MSWDAAAACRWRQADTSGAAAERSVLLVNYENQRNAFKLVDMKTSPPSSAAMLNDLVYAASPARHWLHAGQPPPSTSQGHLGVSPGHPGAAPPPSTFQGHLGVSPVTWGSPCRRSWLHMVIWASPQVTRGPPRRRPRALPVTSWPLRAPRSTHPTPATTATASTRLRAAVSDSCRPLWRSPALCRTWRQSCSSPPPKTTNRKSIRHVTSGVGRRRCGSRRRRCAAAARTSTRDRCRSRATSSSSSSRCPKAMTRWCRAGGLTTTRRRAVRARRSIDLLQGLHPLLLLPAAAAAPLPLSTWSASRRGRHPPDLSPFISHCVCCRCRLFGYPKHARETFEYSYQGWKIKDNKTVANASSVQLFTTEGSSWNGNTTRKIRDRTDFQESRQKRSNILARNVLTWGCADHFVARVTSLVSYSDHRPAPADIHLIYFSLPPDYSSACQCVHLPYPKIRRKRANYVKIFVLLQILPITVTFLFFFRTDSTDSTDCLVFTDTSELISVSHFLVVVLNWLASFWAHV